MKMEARKLAKNLNSNKASLSLSLKINTPNEIATVIDTMRVAKIIPISNMIFLFFLSWTQGIIT